MAKSKFVASFEYILVLLILFFLRITPYLFSKIYAKIVGVLIWLLVPSVRKIIKRNLDIAFKISKTEREKNNIVFKNCLYMGTVVFEVLNFSRFSQNYIKNKTKFINIQHLENALKNNKGVIICCAHYGNWEWSAASIANKYLLNAVYRPLDNKLLDNLLKEFRKKKGYNLLARKESVRKGIDLLKNNEILALMSDQNAAVNGVFIPFFGEQASTMKGPTWFAKKCESTVLCLNDHIDKNGNHSMTFSPPIKMTGDDEKDLIKIHSFFEEVIKEDPTQYFWVHPRWKKRPDGEPSLYNDLRV